MLLAKILEGNPAHLLRNVSASLSISLVTVWQGRECTFPRSWIFWPMQSCEVKGLCFISSVPLQKLFTGWYCQLC